MVFKNWLVTERKIKDEVMYFLGKIDSNPLSEKAKKLVDGNGKSKELNTLAYNKIISPKKALLNIIYIFNRAISKNFPK
ncbi:hypothetical protein [Oceanobacillus saliphilus]|uniref:hypothetical protein n=1 Tax=Oceanobacillus saliphilus TaxID=2925834 RepID=UPI00201DED0F|nr:hypothetical protein [Oceanobacillus saliphilus]